MSIHRKRVRWCKKAQSRLSKKKFSARRVWKVGFLAGFFDRREFIVTQHPSERTICDFWRMVWEQESRLIVTLSSIDSQECRPFWPAIIGEMLSWETNKRGEQMRLTLVEELDTFARRAIRINLELVIFTLSLYSQQNNRKVCCYFQGFSFYFRGESASLDFPQSQLASTVFASFHCIWPHQSLWRRTSSIGWRSHCHSRPVRTNIMSQWSLRVTFHTL